MYAGHSATKAPQAFPGSVKAGTAAGELLRTRKALVMARPSTVSQPRLSRFLFSFLLKEEKKETPRETCNQREQRQNVGLFFFSKPHRSPCL